MGITAMLSPIGLSLLQTFRGNPHRAIAWLVIGGMTIQFGAYGTKTEATLCYVATFMVLFVFVLNALQLFVLPGLVHLVM